MTATAVELSDAEKAAEYDAMMAAKAAGAQQGQRYRVIVSNNMAGDRVLFSSVSEKRAKKFIEQNCPRGSHFFLRAPDGTEMSYEAERAGLKGEDAEPWAEFDRAAYQAPTLGSINEGSDPWADAWEGAQ